MHHKRKRLINRNANQIKTFSLKDTVWEMKAKLKTERRYLHHVLQCLTKSIFKICYERLHLVIK